MFNGFIKSFAGIAIRLVFAPSAIAHVVFNEAEAKDGEFYTA